jgi:hypothetical protein
MSVIPEDESDGILFPRKWPPVIIYFSTTGSYDARLEDFILGVKIQYFNMSR